MSPVAIANLRTFCVENRQPLFTYALSITRQREAAEDVIQLVFQQLLRRDKPVVDLRTYVFRCVRNAALDSVRRAEVRNHSIFDESTMAAPVATAPFSGWELDQSLRALSADEQEIIVLKLYDGFTFQEIADTKGVPLPTVASWYRRGLDKLRATLHQNL
jgi:RNA polymerase sigma-70 factor (ECF subfamily)